VPRKLLTPGWLLLHALALAFLVASFWLGWWQWERSRSAGGSLQNVAYALQWPSFGLFGVYIWWRMLRMELRRDNAEAVEEPGRSEKQPLPEEYDVGSAVGAVQLRAARPATGDDGSAEQEVDEELAAYNRYLAELNARADDER